MQDRSKNVRSERFIRFSTPQRVSVFAVDHVVYSKEEYFLARVYKDRVTINVFYINCCSDNSRSSLKYNLINHKRETLYYNYIRI